MAPFLISIGSVQPAASKIFGGLAEPRRSMRLERYKHYWAAKVFLAVGFWAAVVWLAGVVSMLGVAIWIAFFVDTSQMAAGSLSADSPRSEKFFAIGFNVFLILFGIVWLWLIRAIERQVVRSEASARVPRDG